MPRAAIDRFFDRRSAPKLRYHARLVKALTRSQFKLQYQESALGYLWSLLKPLMLFTVLYLVFGRMLRFGAAFRHFPLYLLLGLVLWYFFVSATTAAMNSIVTRGDLLRRLAFPPLIIPVSATLTAGISFLVSLVPITALIAANRIAPRPSWLLVLPLLIELYLFTLAFSLFLAALYVRFRDTGQLWEVLSQILFFMSPIAYPLELIPHWGQRLMFMNPFTQIMQDLRAVILYDERQQIATVRDVFGLAALDTLFPLVIVATLVILSALYFTREQHWFAEKV